MRALRLPNVSSFSTVAALLGVVSCGSPANNSALFAEASSPAMRADASSGHSIGGTGSASTSSGGTGGLSVAGSASAGSSVEASGNPTNGSVTNGGAPGSAGDGAPAAGAMALPLAGSGGGPATGGGLDDCSGLSNNPTYYPDVRHCYLAVHDLATFAEASSRCSSIGAHLVTLSNSAENDFVWGLDSNEHWIGATDGKGPKDTTPGTYSWIDGEPFTYTDWSQGQPNTSQSTCPESDGGGTCYEHCGFQWSGGAVPGEWNDRLCIQLIESVCEWDG